MCNQFNFNLVGVICGGIIGSKNPFNGCFTYTPIVGICIFSVLLCVTSCPLKFCIHFDWEERTGCFALLFPGVS